jgi:hypothetical protein
MNGKGKNKRIEEIGRIVRRNLSTKITKITKTIKIMNNNNKTLTPKKIHRTIMNKMIPQSKSEIQRRSV